MIKKPRKYNISEQGMEKVKENLPEKNQFKPSHGFYTYKRLNLYPTASCPIHQAGLCEECDEDSTHCLAVENIKLQVMENLSQLEYLKGMPGQILVHEFAQDVAYLFIIDRWISHASALRDNGHEVDLQAVLKRRWTIAESMRRLAESLSITPKQMIELGLSVEQFRDYAKRAQELKK